MHRIRWTLEKIAARLRLLEALVYRQHQPLADFRFSDSFQALVGKDSDDSDWATISPGSLWTAQGKNFTLRTVFTVPSGWKPPVALYLPLGTSSSAEALSFLYGPEALAYLDGEPWQGIDPNHQEILLPDRFLDAQPHTIALQGWGGIKEERYAMGQPCLAEIDQPMRELVASARVALQTARMLPEHDSVRAHLLNALDAAFALLDLREPFGEQLFESVPTALQALREGVLAAGAPLELDIAAVGHAHLDVAWLWPLIQTRRKAARTFSTVLRLMEQFPEFYFTQSQPQLYQYIAEDHPQLFRQIKQRVDEGRWELIGGMWIEADCNITGAESLVRQLLLGRRYFSCTFGRPDSPVLWLPDVFGYAWQLPQLMLQAGLRYFATAKLSWNQYNRIPYDAFWWQGLDGTRVLTYFITTSKPGWWGATYSADLTPDEILTTWQGAQQPEAVREIMIPFGHGDGGGGPSRTMLENSRNMASHPGLPRVRTSTARAFFERLEQDTGSKLPTWDGELYLELHRGTYTSQARNKRWNRKSECLLHTAEFLAAWASLNSAYRYPSAELRRAWELVCLNQFHDIIPGSSIHEVYVDSQRDYEEIRRIGEAIQDEALEALAGGLPESAKLVVYNPTSFVRSEIVEVEGDWSGDRRIISLDGTPLPMQRTAQGVLVAVPPVPPYGYRALGIGTGEAPPCDDLLYAGRPEYGPADAQMSPECAMIMENAQLRMEFNCAGDIVRLFDKCQKREVLPAALRANLWQAFEDRPLDWDAWDIDIFYEDKQWLADPAEHMTVAETGPLRVCLAIERTILRSRITQHIYLYRDSLRVDFKTSIDWQERHILLKVAFPVAILNSRATYEIQWGNVERPTHHNTSWDWARFETCAQKWVDLSEGNYGVSLLNDCKYGHDIHNGVIRLTALKGATFPDPTADLGLHHFTYSLLPHSGDWRNGTVPAAYALNYPLVVRSVQGGAGDDRSPDCRSLVSTSSKPVIIETVKRAEDGDGLIVRLYEHERTRGLASLDAGFELSGAARCTLLEEDQATLEVIASRVCLEVSPYQICTIRLRPSNCL